MLSPISEILAFCQNYAIANVDNRKLQSMFSSIQMYSGKCEAITANKLSIGASPTWWTFQLRNCSRQYNCSRYLKSNNRHVICWATLLLVAKEVVMASFLFLVYTAVNLPEMNTLLKYNWWRHSWTMNFRFMRLRLTEIKSGLSCRNPFFWNFLLETKWPGGA